MDDSSLTTSLKGIKVLLTGGFGYIGKHVALRLLTEGAKVEIWDIKLPESLKKEGQLPWWTGPNLSYNIIDIYENWEQVNYYENHKKFDVVINLAALANVPSCEANVQRAYDVNVYGARRMMILAAKWEALFLQADSAMSPFANASPSTYTTTKALAKKAVEEARNVIGLKGCCLTLYNVAGAHTLGKVGEDHVPETHFIPNIILAYQKGIPMKVDSKAHLIFRDFVHVMDVAEAFFRAVRKHVGGMLSYKDYEVGRGEEVSLHHVLAEAGRMGMIPKTDSFESGRWEPYEHGLRMKANPANFVPGWYPTRGIYTMLWDQKNYMEKVGLPVSGV